MNVTIPDYIIKQYNLTPRMEGKYEEVEPTLLICPQRLDIAAKYLYLEYKDSAPDYARKVYSEHIRVMTKGSYIEPYSEKKNNEAFIKHFDALYDNIVLYGFQSNSIVPVDSNYKILDGAHRVAVCLKLGIKVPIVVVPIKGKYDNYGQAFFEKGGIEEAILDDIVSSYISLSPKTVCINIWPSAVGHDDELFSLINKNFDIIYRKDIKLNENGAVYYLAQIYSEYSWAQNIENGVSDIYRKLLPCFPTFNSVRTVFVERKFGLDLATVKEEMRSLYELGKHSLHITDNQRETIEIGRIILNNNSIEFLNNSKIAAFSNTFSLIKNAIEMNEKHSIIVFTGSIVLALYGVRAADDLDYITGSIRDENSHNELINYYGHSLEELLFDPRVSFSFFNCKFLTLNVIRTFKINRNEGKDKDDVQLIDLVSKNQGKEPFRVVYLRKKRRIVAKVQGQIIRVAHATGTYDLLRNLYKKVKR